MEVVTYSYTNQGGRGNNEDYSCYDYSMDFGVWTLADGLGGHNSGEAASRLAATMIVNDMKVLREVSDNSLLEIINKANKLILSEQKNAAYNGMRTTVVSAFVQDNNFHYFNVGDSRMYYFKNGCLYRQTKDHSVSQVAVALGEISLADIRFHDDRNKLLKVLGDTEDLGILKIEDKIPMESGDAFLLCSDGFWEYVFETEMEIDLLKAQSPRQWIEFMVKRLLLRVTGNNDNFSVIGCFIG
ncbi:MAG: PP2C family protein-serine/threonine phosphatase [Ruminiclostridium sp.]